MFEGKHSPLNIGTFKWMFEHLNIPLSPDMYVFALMCVAVWCSIAAIITISSRYNRSIACSSLPNMSPCHHRHSCHPWQSCHHCCLLVILSNHVTLNNHVAPVTISSLSSLLFLTIMSPLSSLTIMSPLSPCHYPHSCQTAMDLQEQQMQQTEAAQRPRVSGATSPWLCGVARDEPRRSCHVRSVVWPSQLCSHTCRAHVQWQFKEQETWGTSTVYCSGTKPWPPCTAVVQNLGLLYCSGTKPWPPSLVHLYPQKSPVNWLGQSLVC